MPFTPLNLDSIRNPQSNNNSIFKFGNVQNTPPQVTPQTIIQKLASKYNAVSNTLGNFSEGVAKGALSTLKGLGQVGTKIGNAVLPKSLEFSEVYSNESLQANAEAGGAMGKLLNKENLAAKGTAQSIGKATEQIGEFFIPAGKVSAVEKLLAGGAKTLTTKLLAPVLGEKLANLLSHASSLGAKMVVRSTEAGGVIGIQSGGDPEAIKTAAEVGGAFPALGAVAKKIIVNPLTKGIAQRFAGRITGRGTAVVDEILNDPKSALESLGTILKKADTAGAVETNINLIKKGGLDLQTKANQEYSRVLNNVQNAFDQSSESFNKSSEIKKVGDVLGGKGIELGEDGLLKFEKTRFDPKKDSVIQKAFNMVRNYPGVLTPKSMDTLAARLEHLKSATGTTPDADMVVQDIINSLRNSVGEMADKLGYPEGSQMAKKYAVAKGEINNFNKLFRTSSAPFLSPEEKSAMSTDIRLLFAGDKDNEKVILKKLGLQDVISREAGRQLATATERASGNIGGSRILNAISEVLFPPRVIGIITAKLGQSKTPRFIEVLMKLSPAARGSVIELLSKQ